jgi:hypothetical protein
MLDDINWLMDARWIVVNAKKPCRVSVKAARDGMEASEVPSQIGLELAIGGVHPSSSSPFCSIRLSASASHCLAEIQSTTHSSTQLFAERKHPHNMALPKRIIKETERLMAEPYVYPYTTIISMS